MTFDNITQAASALGLSQFQLSEFKRIYGCHCFRNGRVYGAGLVEWLRDNYQIFNLDLKWENEKLTPAKIDVVEAKLAAIDASLRAARRVKA
jgi:hypothetical protein